MARRIGELSSIKKLNANKVNYCSCSCGGAFFVIQYVLSANHFEIFCSNCGTRVSREIEPDDFDGGKILTKIFP